MAECKSIESNKDGCTTQTLTHQEIGKRQKLFMTHPLSPGSIFVLPHGQRIYNKLVELMRQEYHVRNYLEVSTPVVYNTELWKVSGHYDHYASHMFALDVDKQACALKPMNCPSHCLIFASANRSYRDLPVRLADFGVLHRNEFTGALVGLTRVRKFCQDDAHLFCREDQMASEIQQALHFMRHVYGWFGFKYEVCLSTRPDDYLGTVQLWDRAESALAEALRALHVDFTVNAKDGAFYGPKIDVRVQDALGRFHQCGTIQLDFQLPLRFGLEYRDADNVQRRPVIVHRAILGSVERMMAILMEHYQGKWPFWLSPRQIAVVAVNKESQVYARRVHEELVARGYHTDLLDDADSPLKQKIKEAETDHYSYVVVLGAKESADQTCNIRGVGVKAREDAYSFFASLRVPQTS